MTTYDAIHPGSVIASDLDAIIVTHDAALAAASASLGYPIFDPVIEQQ